MATTSTIGTSSRNYATITLWHAAFANGGWIGECYNDSEFNETPSIGGSSGVNYEILRPAAGQSAFDTANPLTYDVTKGVGLKNNANYATVLTIGSYLTVERMQVQNTGSGNGANALSITNNAVGVIISRNLALQSGTSGLIFPIAANGGGGSSAQVISNSVMIAYKANGFKGLYFSGVLANNTIVSPSDKSNSSSAIDIGGNQNPIITNCAGFGFSGGFCTHSGNTPTGTNNATDASSIGFTSSGSLTSQTYANQFTGITTTGGLDFRLKAGNSLDGAGATDTTDIPAGIDIFGTTR